MISDKESTTVYVLTRAGNILFDLKLKVDFRSK